MPTIVKRGSAARPVASKITTATAPADGPFLGSVDDAVTRWRSWATAMADGKPCPAEPRDLLDVAATLRVRDPAATLAADADAILAVRALDERRRAANEADERDLAEHGGNAGIQRKMEALREEIQRLQVIASCPRSWNGVGYRQQAAKIQKQTPRIYATTYRGEAT